MSIENLKESEQDSEISLLDIVQFLQSAWKKLAISAVLGAILGFAGWFFLGSYQAELTLVNNGGTNLVGWRSLQKSLPNLAEQILDENKAPPNQVSVYKTLTNDQWWQKNAIANYAMTKADTKDLASTVGLESAGTSVVSIVLRATGASKEKALENVRQTQNFLIQGAAFLAIKSMISSQESQVVGIDADIAKKVNATQVELTYQQERLKNLENLAKRFPSEQKTVSQVVDPKDSGAKYLPLSTQIIAANTEINSSKESLERLKDQQAQAEVLKTWVTQASPLVDRTFDGFALIKQLLEQEAALRAAINPQDLKSLAFVDNLRANLLAIQVQHTKGFEMNTAPIATKKGMIKSTAGGLAAAFFLMLLFLLGQKVWANVNQADVIRSVK